MQHIHVGGAFAPLRDDASSVRHQRNERAEQHPDHDIVNEPENAAPLRIKLQKIIGIASGEQRAQPVNLLDVGDAVNQIDRRNRRCNHFCLPPAQQQADFFRVAEIAEIKKRIKCQNPVERQNIAVRAVIAGQTSDHNGKAQNIDRAAMLKQHGNQHKRTERQRIPCNAAAVRQPEIASAAIDTAGNHPHRLDRHIQHKIIKQLVPFPLADRIFCEQTIDKNECRHMEPIDDKINGLGALCEIGFFCI